MDEIMISEEFASLQDKIELMGFLAQDELKKIYARSDVFCLPSVSEPFGLAALEAAQFGIPVVLSSRSGVSEVLKSAPKADYWDIDLMAQHIAELLSNEEYHNKMAKAGLDEIKNFTWKKASNQILKIYDALIPG
jgi:glycosyltransferase involved in cell wall biosynthesis